MPFFNVISDITVYHPIPTPLLENKLLHKACLQKGAYYKYLSIFLCQFSQMSCLEPFYDFFLAVKLQKCLIIHQTSPNLPLA